MPFLGKDWRSDGDQWIRTDLGWERTKVLECILDNLNVGLRKEKSRAFKRKSNSASVSSEMNENDEEETSGFGEAEDGYEMSDVKFELSILSDNEEDEDDTDNDLDEMNDEEIERKNEPVKLRRRQLSLQKLSISSSDKKKQPHIIYWTGAEASNRENNAPKASVSEVLNALDMPGAVCDIKRFNYVCRLVQLIINEKLNQLSGNAQRTLFMIVKQMLIQVIRTQENVNVMRKLLLDFKKKIQDSFYFHFFYIGSQKLGDKHLSTIAKWQEMLDNPNHKRVKRLIATRNISTSLPSEIENDKENEPSTISTIPLDCKIEIIRRLNNGLDLMNLSKCNRDLNTIISKELKIWQNLCAFHFQQTHINNFVRRSLRLKAKYDPNGEVNPEFDESNLRIGGNCENDEKYNDWKMIYFKLKRRYGHREIYADMIHKCLHCKCLFWKEIGHPCIIMSGLGDQMFDLSTEPITPKKLIDLLLR